jgi:hypothetical protein
MAFSRYTSTPPSSSGRGLATPEAANNIYQAVKSGFLPCTSYMLKESERLDHIAHKKLGDASLWWVLAATSGIGWGLQLPPGTLVNIPDSMATVYDITRRG